MSYFLHDSAIVDKNVNIGNGTKIWHWTHICSGANIGSNCVIGQNVYIGPNVKIGNNVKIQNNVSVYAGVDIEDFVFLGPSVVFTNVTNPRSEFQKKNYFKKTIVKRFSTIGANSTIVCGNILNEYSFLGAGSLLTKNINSFELWYGNPAEKKGWIDEFGNNITKEILKNKRFTLKDKSQTFELKNNILIKK